MTCRDLRRASISVAGLAALAGCAAAGAPGVRAPQPPEATITTTDLLIDSIDGNNMRADLSEARTRFDFGCRIHASLTADHGCIVDVTELRRKPTASAP